MEDSIISALQKIEEAEFNSFAYIRPKTTWDNIAKIQNPSIKTHLQLTEEKMIKKYETKINEIGDKIKEEDEENFKEIVKNAKEVEDSLQFMTENIVLSVGIKIRALSE